MDKAVIQGNLVKLIPVQTRGVYQLIVEIPEEYADHAVKAFGMPTSQKSIHVAIARLVSDVSDAQREETHHRQQDTGQAGDKPVSRIKAFKTLVNDAEFVNYIKYHRSYSVFEDNPEIFIKKKLGIESSKELDGNQDAWDGFQAIRNDFLRYRKAKQQYEAMR